jgi:serine/threonine protein kinase
MIRPDTGTAGGPPDDGARLEDIVSGFERAWQAGRRPDLEQYLPAGDPCRQNLLGELVHADLEYRLKAGEVARVEQYLTRFPELGADRVAVLQLIAAEYRLRRDREPGVTPEDYLARFPQYGSDLSTPLREHGPVSGRRAVRPQGTSPNASPVMRPSADRNLLFGILAVQMDFISREALLRAMQAWVFEKGKPLGQILVEQGALSVQRRELLEALVREHLRQHGDDPEKSLASLSSLGSPRAGLAGIADADVQASLARVSAARSEPNPESTVNESAGTSSVPGQRFRILRPHARGGLGEVYVALDGELHREVALKEIQQAHAGHAESRARFLLEAEVTGGLEHPGIVPVYGLGFYADGRPYYAMRFVRGESLKQAIERFHQADAAGGDPGERVLALRGLLGRFVDVCQAMAYAHSRGVLHRDLKPGNVMLGPYGETLVVDWGLAKVVGRPEAEAGSGEGTLRPPSAGDSAPTEMGRVVGTPAYMSPEQAAGRLDLLGPASDVYSLGATLYALLTGRPPFEGRGAAEVLEKVRQGALVPPRQVHGGVPAALDAVCRKALALRPGERYPSAGALAEDVERFLADEPVSAYPEPVGTRLRRWLQKHRVAAVSTAAVAAVLGVVGVAWTLVAAAESGRAQAQQYAGQKEEAARIMAGLRDEAEGQALLARRYRYIADMNLAQRAWQESDMRRLDELLEQYRTAPEGEPDLRGFEWSYLRRLAHGEVLSARYAGNCLAFSPDGRWLASGAGGGGAVPNEVKFWDARTGQEVFTLKTADPVNHLAFSPDGRRLATAGYRQPLRVWDLESRQTVLVLSGKLPPPGARTILPASPSARTAGPLPPC